MTVRPTEQAPIKLKCSSGCWSTFWVVLSCMHLFLSFIFLYFFSCLLIPCQFITELRETNNYSQSHSHQPGENSHRHGNTERPSRGSNQQPSWCKATVLITAAPCRLKTKYINEIELYDVEPQCVHWIMFSCLFSCSDHLVSRWSQTSDSAVCTVTIILIF